MVRLWFCFVARGNCAEREAQAHSTQEKNLQATRVSPVKNGVKKNI